MKRHKHFIGQAGWPGSCLYNNIRWHRQVLITLLDWLLRFQQTDLALDILFRITEGALGLLHLGVAWCDCGDIILTDSCKPAFICWLAFPKAEQYEHRSAVIGLCCHSRFVLLSLSCYKSLMPTVKTEGHPFKRLPEIYFSLRFLRIMCETRSICPHLHHHAYRALTQA